MLTIVLVGDFGRRAVRSQYAPFALMIGLALLGWSIWRDEEEIVRKETTDVD